jgi:D-isomer specific 2-hydroxyacid dehydrogenase, catalytic domain
MKIAILDDYQNVALKLADWSAVVSTADITVFNDHLADPDAVVARLLPFDVICVMRERTPLPRGIIERLPRLKLIVSTGPRNASIDMEAVEERGIRVTGTGRSVCALTRHRVTLFPKFHRDALPALRRTTAAFDPKVGHWAACGADGPAPVIVIRTIARRSRNMPFRSSWQADAKAVVRN